MGDDVVDDSLSPLSTDEVGWNERCWGRGSEIHFEGDRTWCGACLSRLLDFYFGKGLNICV